MFARSFKRFSAKKLRFRALNTSSRTLRSPRIGLGVAATAVAGSALLYLRPSVIENDGPTAEFSQKFPTQKLQPTVDDNHLHSLVWGTNQSHLLSPQDDEDSIRTPTIAKWLEDVALRDVTLHKSHAACVDARGDVYQWGDGFFGEEKRDTLKLTLRGKNIKMLKATEHRIFALSTSGRVYVLSAHESEQQLPPGKSTVTSDSWWGAGWLWGEDQTIDFAEIMPNVSLSRGEKFVAISAGHDHLLGLTSKGRTFAHPFNDKSNAYGQLGLRKFDIPSGSSSERTSVELIPKFTADPFARASRYSRQSSQPTLAPILDEKNIRSSDRFFELPSLKGVEIAQIATGGRTSFARTKTGQVLGWGANEYGQVGLGSSVTLDTITVPTEVILWKTAGGRTLTRCVDIIAGGDLTCFVVERANEKSVPTYDVLMCGNGQWGGLGSNVYTNVQGEPVKSRNVSGLLEYSEQNQRLEPIVPHAVSVSPTGHVLLTLDTLVCAQNANGSGRDLYVWGANHESELGNNKRSSLAMPTTLETNNHRFMLGKKERVQVLKDMKGKVWKKNSNVVVEQCAVAGWKTSLVYWKIVS